MVVFDIALGLLAFLMTVAAIIAVITIISVFIWAIIMLIKISKG